MKFEWGRFYVRLALALWIVGAVIWPACGGKVPPALVSANPQAADVQQVRAFAVRVADATTAGLDIANQTGVLINALPLASEIKDGYDCPLLKVIGTNSAPSATVTKICGSVPTKATAPLAVALQKLAAVTTCPGLRTTVVEILGAIDPLIARLANGGNAALGFAATALQATFRYTRSVLSGGASCASI